LGGPTGVRSGASRGQIGRPGRPRDCGTAGSAAVRTRDALGDSAHPVRAYGRARGCFTAYRILTGVWLDRRTQGKPIRLNLAGVLLAAAASGLLLLLPLRTGPPRRADGRVFDEGPRSILQEDGLSGLVIFAIPVAVVAVPLLFDILGRVRFRIPAQMAAAALRGLAAVSIVAWMFYNSLALVGFLYLPSAAAMIAAAMRSYRRTNRPPRLPGTACL
jgi:hypothetical protein